MSTRPAPNFADHLVRNGGALQGNLNQILLGVFNALADRVRHFAGLPEAEANQPIAVADNDQRGELEDRPPFTVLLTRLIATMRSFISIVDASFWPKLFPPFP